MVIRRDTEDAFIRAQRTPERAQRSETVEVLMPQRRQDAHANQAWRRSGMSAGEARLMTEQIGYRSTPVPADVDHAGCAPDGQHCARCNGTHNPHPGWTFITARTWTVDDADDDEGQP